MVVYGDSKIIFVTSFLGFCCDLLVFLFLSVMYKILITQGIQSIVSTLTRVFVRLAIFVTQQLLRFLCLINMMTLKRIAVLLFIFSQVVWAPLLYAAEVGHAPNNSETMVTDAKTSVGLDRVLSSGQAGSTSGTTPISGSGSLAPVASSAKASYTVGPSTASSTTTSGATQNSQNNKPSVVSLGTKSDVDESSGAFLYSLPIKTPAGRAGLSPSINLSYDSRRNNQTSYIGLGWDIEMPTVQRMNKNGIDVMYDETNFTATGYGELSRTTNTGAQFGQYSVKYGFGEFIYRDNNTWEITDKNGVTSVYGATARDRIDTGDVDRTQSWVLSKQTDQLGNIIDYTYIKSEGKLYPQSIIYNDGAARIDFTYNVLNTKTAVPQYDSYGNKIADDIGEVVDYGSGVRAKADRILSNISVTAMGDRRLDYQLQGGDYLRSVSGEFGNIQFQYREQMQAPTVANENLAVINNPANYVERYGNYANPRTTNGAFMYRWYPTSGFNSGATWTDIDRDGKKEMIGVYTDWLIDSQRTVSDYYFWYNPVNYQNKRVIEIYQVDKTATYGFTEKTNLRLTSLTSSNFEFDSSITTSAQTISSFYISNAWMNGENLVVTVTNINNTSQSFSGYLTFDTTKNKYVLKASTTAVTPPPAAPSPYPTIPTALQTEIQKYNQPYITWYDVDYDDKLDLIVQHKDGMRVYHNDGTTGSVTNFSYAPQYDLTGIKIADTATPTFILWRDINGDGLDDLYRAGKWFLNRRTMMQYSEGYTMAGQAKEFIISSANQLVDINGDSLLDIPAAQRINTGTGFEVVSNKALNAMGTKTALYNVQATGSAMSQDIRNALSYLGCNPDYIQSSTYCSDRASLMNLVGAWALPWNYMSLAFETDMNNDGITDKIYTYNGTYYVVFMKEGVAGPLSALDRDYVGKMVVINNNTPSGPAQTSITYKKEKLDNERIDGSPATVWAVDAIDYGKVYEYSPTYKETPVKYTYAYNGGRIYKDPTEMSKRTPGFARVTETDPLGFSTTSYFHQGNGDDTTSYEQGDNVPGKIGRTYRTETKNPAGEIMQVGINKYGSVDLGNSKQYVYLEQSQSYDKQKGLGTVTGYTVDTTIGEVTRTHDYGRVTPSSWDTLNGTWTDTDSDGLISETEYTATLPLVRPVKSIVRDLSTKQVLRESSYQYDGGIMTKGLLTKQSDRVDSGKTVSTMYAYSPRGTLISSVNPLGDTTTYNIDKQELYPVSITNSLGHTTSVVMDYLLGKPKKIIYPDGLVEEYEYHPIYGIETKYTRGGVLARDANIYGRTTSSTEYYTSIYTLPAGAPNIKMGNSNITQTINVNPQGLIENTWSLANGTTSYRYNARGQETQFTPSGASSSYAINKSYDSYGRLSNSVSPLGTTSYTYNNLSVTETRPNGGITTNTYDSRGRLKSVTDNNGTATYSYDGMGNLTGITDADGNKRDFTYDMIGQRKQMTDYYRPGDNTYGVYGFTYDDMGRVITEQRPDGSTVATTYDKLSRPLTINMAGDLVTYTYDTCKIGKVCTVSRGDGYSNSYTYNDAGYVSSEIKTIRGQSRTFNYGYNVNGSISRAISPLGTLEYYYPGNGYSGGKPTYIYWNGNDTARKNGGQYSNPMGIVNYAHNNLSLSYVSNTFASSNPNTAKRITMNTYWNYDWNKLGLASNAYAQISSPVTNGQISSETYTYNGNADITKIVNTGTLTGKTTDYTYDPTGRLTRYQVTSPTKGNPVDVSYSYSPAGNIQSITPTGANTTTTNMTYNLSGAGMYLPGTSAPAASTSSTSSSSGSSTSTTSGSTSGTGSSTTSGTTSGTGSTSGTTGSGTTSGTTGGSTTSGTTSGGSSSTGTTSGSGTGTGTTSGSGTTSGTSSTTCTSPQVWSATANACVTPTALNTLQKIKNLFASIRPILINTAYAEETTGGSTTGSGTTSGSTTSGSGSTTGSGTSSGSGTTSGTTSGTCTAPLVWDTTTSTCVTSTTSGSGTSTGTGSTTGTGGSTTGGSGTTSGTGTGSGTTSTGGTTSGTGTTGTTSGTTGTTSQTVNDLITSLLQKIQSGAFTIQQDGRMYTVVDTAGATTTATAQKTSGNITINRGQTTATITFKTSFASTPEIIVTPSNSHAGTVVTIVSKSATGFTISVPSKDYTAKRAFTYLAFVSDQDNGESAPDDIPVDIADIYRDINKLDQQVVDEANMVNVYTNPHAILRYGNTYMVYNKLGQVILVKSYSNPTCTGGTETTPPTCTTPTLLSTQSRTYTGDGRTKNIDSSTSVVNTDYDETGNKVYEEVIDKATGTKKTTTYWSDTERTYHTCTGTTCTLDREEKDILVDGRRHATMIVKNGVETYRYYLTNTLGTTSLALSEDGAILEDSDINPYGDIRYGTNNNDVTTYYGLHERNDTTGLIDMEARMYDPTNLQFSAPDPISLYNPTAYLSDPSQMHMYAYAKGNPVRYNDPTGQCVGVIGSLVCDVLEPYIVNSSLIEPSKKEVFFAINNPINARIIGDIQHFKPSISSYSSDFAINATNQNGKSLFEGDQFGDGTEMNAFRHTLWQATITRDLGERTAKRVASAHEVNPKANKTRRSFSSLGEADEVVDLLNNEIGREIGKNNPNMSNSQLAVHVASYMKQQGLYVAKPSNGGYVVSQQKTTPQQFSKQISSLSKTGNNGKYKK